VEDICTRAKKNGCNLLMQPLDKLKGALAVSAAFAHSCTDTSSESGKAAQKSPVCCAEVATAACRTPTVLQCFSCSNNSRMHHANLPSYVAHHCVSL
jgi:hypothetical protein